VPEWSKGAVLKTAGPGNRFRGFESHPRRKSGGLHGLQNKCSKGTFVRTRPAENRFVGHCLAHNWPALVGGIGDIGAAPSLRQRPSVKQRQWDGHDEK
jgi:hypothetical protein